MSRPWMPLYVADYLADTSHLRAAESGAYLHLIMHYWQHGGLPEGDRQLATIAKMSDDEWASVKETLQAMFQPGWKHKRIKKELAEAEEKYRRRAEAGRKGGAATAKQSPSNATTELNHSSVVVLTDNPPSPENQSELAFEKKKIRSEDTRARAKPACRLPEDWGPTLADLVFARTLLPSGRELLEVEKFRDYWHARAGPHAVKRDWSAAWRTWCRKSVEMSGGGNGTYQQNRGGNNQNGPGRGEGFSAFAKRRATAD